MSLQPSKGARILLTVATMGIAARVTRYPRASRLVALSTGGASGDPDLATHASPRLALLHPVPLHPAPSRSTLLRPTLPRLPTDP